MNEAILITGVGKRVGYHLAKYYLKRDIPIVGTYRTRYDSIEELLELGADLHAVDFYNSQELAEFIKTVSNKYQSLRAIIHNASDWIPESSSDFENIFTKMMQIHAALPYQVNLALKDLLLNSSTDFADIIHFTDYVASRGSKKHIAYAASKAALENLTLSFAQLLAPKVKVNSIAPALIKFNDHDDEEYKNKAFGKSLIPSEGGYRSVIETVEYLLNSNYITGRSFALDGGRHLK